MLMLKFTKKISIAVVVVFVFLFINNTNTATAWSEDNIPPDSVAERPNDVMSPFFLFLPVNDEELNAQFFEYHVDFNNFAIVFNDYRNDFYDYWGDMLDWIEQDTDSLKNLLGGAEPGGVADEVCITRLIDPNDPTDPDANASYNMTLAFNIENLMFGPMLDPDDFDNKTVAENPGDFVRVQPLVSTSVNDSGSLRCLLQELVEWQKLDLNLTIHKMMKEFIHDSQSFLLAKQTQSFIVAGLMDHSRYGVTQQLAQDKEVAASTFASNPEHELHKRNSSVRMGMVSQIQGNEDGFEPLDIFDPFRTDIARSVSINNLQEEVFDIEFLSSDIANTLGGVFDLDTTAVEEQLAGDFSQAGWDGFGSFLRPENNPITIVDIAGRNLTLQTNQMATNQYSMISKGNGFIDTTMCVDSNDPWCRIREVITPSFINEETLSHTVEAVGGDALTQSDESGEKPGDTAVGLQSDIVTTGSLRGYDTESLETQSPNFNAAYIEFYEILDYGYYDINDDITRIWGQNALSEITDEIYRQSIFINGGTFGPDY